MKPLCLIPWTNIDISPDGKIAPCCKYSVPDSELLDITKTSIAEYANSENLKQLKKQMHDNIWPDACIRCRTEEENNIKSKRQLDYDRWKEQYDNYTPDQGFITASIAFGNTCNLKCITCNSFASSRWRKEYKDIYGKDNVPIEVIDNMTSNDIYSVLPNAIHFDIPGGEPFLSEINKQLDLLKRYVESGQSQHMTLHYTTNAQVFPDEKWWNLWSHFKEIDLQLSIDGVGSKYEYIRYPAKTDLLETNVQKYQCKQLLLDNFRLSVSHTLSAYNVFYLGEFFDWCERKRLPRPWIGKVHGPRHMRSDVFPSKVRKQIASHMRTSKHEDVHIWADYIENNSSDEYYNDWVKYKDKHDVYRNTNFAKTFPELEELINGFQ